MVSVDQAYKIHAESWLKASSDLDEFKNVVENLISKLGFTHFSFEKIVGNNNFELMLNSVPADLLAEYVDSEIFAYDYMIECVECSHEPVFQNSIFEHILTSPYKSKRFDKNLKLKSILNKNKIYEYVSIPIHTEMNGERVVTSFSVYCESLSPEDFKKLVDSNLGKLQYLASNVHKIGYKKYAIPLNDNVPIDGGLQALTKREVHILQQYLECRFKVDAVAKNISRSETTIRKHTANIRSKLNVTSTYEAVSLAANAGLIKGSC